MKKRLDILLVERALAPSREKAKAIIMAGAVLVEGRIEDKPGAVFPEIAQISVKENPIPYVSRGGLKLEKALKVFNIEPAGKVCMDVGSSTGGFTDCMLQNGAAKVYCVDVGYGQLDWKLRNDPRVVCMEKTNIRYLNKDSLDEMPQLVSVDVSFISLTKVLNVVYALMAEEGEVVALIKPQFEAGRSQVGKKGVVRDPKVHKEVIRKIIKFAASQGFVIYGIDFSPVKGPEGNIEYLIFLKKVENGNGSDILDNSSALDEMADKTVETSHAILDT